MLDAQTKVCREAMRQSKTINGKCLHFLSAMTFADVSLNSPFAWMCH